MTKTHVVKTVLLKVQEEYDLNGDKLLLILKVLLLLDKRAGESGR